MPLINPNHSDQESSAEINLAPLLDIVFILLIFFIVTTTFTRETGVEVKKPKASSASSVKEEIIKVAITVEGSVHIFERQVTLEELRTILEREKNKNPKIKLVLVADKKSTTDRIVEVIDQANLAGIQDTSLAAINR